MIGLVSLVLLESWWCAFLKGNHQGAKNTKITKDQQRIAHFHRRWLVNGRMSSSRDTKAETLGLKGYEYS